MIFSNVEQMQPIFQFIHSQCIQLWKLLDSPIKLVFWKEINCYVAYKVVNFPKSYSISDHPFMVLWILWRKRRSWLCYWCSRCLWYSVWNFDRNYLLIIFVMSFNPVWKQIQLIFLQMILLLMSQNVRQQSLK